MEAQLQLAASSSDSQLYLLCTVHNVSVHHSGPAYTGELLKVILAAYANKKDPHIVPNRC